MSGISLNCNEKHSSKPDLTEAVSWCSVMAGLISDRAMTAESISVSEPTVLKISADDFRQLRMEDKIQALKDHLPKFLVDNKSLYSILSTGIHQLNEEDCLSYFDTVRAGIEIILDEKLEEIKRQEKMKIAQQKISDLQGRIKSNK